MSEYQYYEFQAIDRPLTDREMGELRSYSTRARITPTSFVDGHTRCGLIVKRRRADASQHSREARSIVNAAPKKVLR